MGEKRVYQYSVILLYYKISKKKDCNIPIETSIKIYIVTLYCSVLKDV